MKTQPFGRALALMAAMSAAAGQGAFALAAAQAAAGGYKSRGHGKGVPGKNHHRGSPSKYAPHQGAQECLRRRLEGWSRVHGGKGHWLKGEAETPQLQPNGTYTYSDGSYVRFLHSEGL